MYDDLLALLWLLIKIVIILVPLLLGVAYAVYFERKVMGCMQSRIGPNRVGPFGLLQSFADLLKMLSKEVITPSASSPILFKIAPLIALVPALAAWAVVPFGHALVLANMNAGLLVLLSLTSLGIYGSIIAGWASNSKYAMLAALRAGAQAISYEIAMGFCFVGVLLLSGTLNLSRIVLLQQGGFWHWYLIPLFPLAVIYWIAAVAETNRLPFDMVEGESELVAGFHVEYSGISFGLFFLAEYANMLLVSAIMSLLFLGGWLSPFQGIVGLESFFAFVPGLVWFLVKIAFFMLIFFWMRSTFPRYRYDQIMYLGWKVLIPVSLLWILLVSIWLQLTI